MTGHKSSVNALGVYADRTQASQDDPKQETIAELLRRKTNKAIGVVSDAEIEDATPASVVSHTRRRADKADIVRRAFFGPVTPEVPASILQFHPNVTVVVDKEAAALCQ